MKLRTSFFDKTVFRKDRLRFAPLWALYFIGGMMVMLTVSDSHTPHYAANYVGQTIGLLSVVNLIYAGLVAQLLFGDLFKSRLCNALHAMPLRREGWFVTHALAGVCFSLIPNAVGIFFVMFRMGAYWYVALYWLLGMTLQYLFFFGLAVFSVFCTGKRFAAVAVYAILNFASMIALWFCSTIYEPMMFGVEIDQAPFNLLCPVVQLCSATEYLLWRDAGVAGGYQEVFNGLGDNWGYMTAIAGIGVALLAVSLLMYRRRKLECAGDFIAVKPLGPVFAVVFTLCAGALFAMFGQLTKGDYAPYLILGMAVGWFAAQMLLQRTVKVFRIKAFLKAGALIVLMFISVLLVQVDAFNIVGWVPKAEDVQAVTLANYKASAYSFDLEGSYYYGNRISLKLTEQEEIEKIIFAHEDILGRKDEHVSRGHRVVLTYELKNGRKVQRNYWAPADGVNYEIVSEFLNSPELVLGYTNWNEFVKRVNMIYFANGEVPKDLYRQMLEALKADCENGQVSLTETKDTVQLVHLEGSDEQGRYISRRLAVHSGAEKTLSLMKSPRVIMGYSDWEAFVAGVEYVIVADQGLGIEKYAGKDGLAAFLDALRTDCENGHIWLSENDGEYCTKVEYSTRGSNAEYIYRFLYVGKNAENTLAWLQKNLPEAIAP